MALTLLNGQFLYFFRPLVKIVKRKIVNLDKSKTKPKSSSSRGIGPHLPLGSLWFQPPPPILIVVVTRKRLKASFFNTKRKNNDYLPQEHQGSGLQLNQQRTLIIRIGCSMVGLVFPKSIIWWGGKMPLQNQLVQTKF